MSSLRLIVLVLIVLVLIVTLPSAATAEHHHPDLPPVLGQSDDEAHLCAKVDLDGRQLQEVFPLTLVSPTVDCANGNDFVNVSRPVHAEYFRRDLDYVVRVRDANTASKASHNSVHYLAEFTKKGSKQHLYAGNLYAGDLGKGGWSTFTLKPADPPKTEKGKGHEAKKHHHHHHHGHHGHHGKKTEQEKGNDYFQLKVRVIGRKAGVDAKHRVYDAVILVYQKKSEDKKDTPKKDTPKKDTPKKDTHGSDKST